MRTLLLSAAALLQGCSVLGAGGTAVANDRRRIDATTAGTEIGARPPAVGDTLTVYLVLGEPRRGAVVGVTADSLRLDVGAFSLRDIDRVVQLWTRDSVGEAFFLGAAVDFALMFFVMRDLQPQNNGAYAYP